MTVRDIARHLSELYGTEIGRDTISRVTDAVLEDVAAWRTRPLAARLPDRLLRLPDGPRPRGPLGQLARLLSGHRRHGRRRPRGARDLVAGDRGRQVLAGGAQRPAPARRRGRPDRLRRRPDRLPGGDRGGLPQAWVQTCIVHQIRSSMRYVTYTTAGRSPPTCAPSTRRQRRGRRARSSPPSTRNGAQRYPMIARVLAARWDYITPFLALPADLRRVVYTTNSIENLNRQIRKAIKTRGHFPDEQAATKLIYLAIQRAQTAWSAPTAGPTALRALKIHFGDRSPRLTPSDTSHPTSHTEGRTVSDAAQADARPARAGTRSRTPRSRPRRHRSRGSPGARSHAHRGRSPAPC